MAAQHLEKKRMFSRETFLLTLKNKFHTERVMIPCAESQLKLLGIGSSWFNPFILMDDLTKFSLRE